MKDLLASEWSGSDSIDDTHSFRSGVIVDVPQCASPGPLPLAIIIRPTTAAATAVAARIVRNQYRRLPSSAKNFVLRAGADRARAVVECDEAAGEARDDRAAGLTRRCGEIQGQIVWNRRLLSTPERPYKMSTTAAKIASSRKPIMMMPPIYWSSEAANTRRSPASQLVRAVPLPQWRGYCN
jgi:hypothetical protein